MMQQIYGPRHVAIIMDGNGRWAERRSLPRFRGHAAGVKRVEEIVDVAPQFDIKVLTLFTFSTENWCRPEDEVSMLMRTICAVLEKKLRKLVQDNVRLQFIGRREGIPEEVLQQLDDGVKATRNNEGLILNLAFNYGSRLEIIDAVRELAQQVKQGAIDIGAIDEQMMGEHLYTKGLPDPDLLIRTSGERRISNFLLWQLSYAEFYFTDVCWPEFTADELYKAVQDYRRRERRFGGIMANSAKEST